MSRRRSGPRTGGGTARRAVLALAASSLLLGGGCRFGDRRVESDSAEPVPTVEARRGRFRVTVDEVGVVLAERSASVQAPFYGKIRKLVPEGSEVTEGEPVLWMETTELERRLERARAEFVAASSELEKQLERAELQARATGHDLAKLEAQREFQEAKLGLTRSEAEDARRRADLGLIRDVEAERRERALARAELDHRKAVLQHERQLEEMKSAERRIEVERQEAERKMAEARERRSRYEKRLAEAVVHAPASGRVFLPKIRIWGSPEPRKVRVSDQVGPWMRALVELPDLDSLHVRSQVDESLIDRVVPGLPAEVTVTALEGLTLPARVERIDTLARPRSDVDTAGFSSGEEGASEQVVFQTTLALEESDPRLQPGMTVAVTYLLEELPVAVSVPREAVFGPSESPVVFVRDGGGYEVRSVALGPTSGRRVVVSEGLEAGEDVYLGDPRGSRS